MRYKVLSAFAKAEIAQLCNISDLGIWGSVHTNFQKIDLFLYLWVHVFFFASINVSASHIICAVPAEDIRSSASGVMKGWDLPQWFLELNPDTLKEQPVFYHRAISPDSDNNFFSFFII